MSYNIYYIYTPALPVHDATASRVKRGKKIAYLIAINTCPTSARQLHHLLLKMYRYLYLYLCTL